MTLSELPNFFRIAKLARDLSDYPKSAKKMGAVLVRSGNVLAFSPNRNKSHPAYERNFFVHSIHAELAALIICEAKLQSADIYIYREGADGKIAMAKPCQHCFSALKLAGIRRAFYTVPSGFEIMEIN